MQAFAVAVAITMYISCMDAPVILFEEDSGDYSVWGYVAFCYLNATSFLVSVTIIMLLVNCKLPASGIRWYALWVSGILCLVCFLGNHVATHIYWKVPIFSQEVLLVMFLCGIIGDMEMVHEVRNVLLLLGDGEDIVVLEDDIDSSDGEMQIGLAGGGPNDEPLSLEISSSILGGALTLVLAVPARDNLYNPMQVVGAFVTATIVSAVWRRVIAPLLLRLTGALQRQYSSSPTQQGTTPNTSSTPQPRTAQAFCHGLFKVIRTLCSGSWVWILTLWVLSVKPNIGMKFKISKLTSPLDVFLGIGGTPTPTLVTAMPTTRTLTIAPHPVKQPDQNCLKLLALHSSAPAAATTEEPSFLVAAEPPFGGGGHGGERGRRGERSPWSGREGAARFSFEQVGYVPSHLAMQKADDDWASQRHIVLIIIDLTVIADGANAHAEEGNVAVVDWNASMDRDEEERDEANTSDNDDRELSEDVDEQLMKDVADDVDDAHDEELVHVYDKENPVIRVGKLWPNMDEFRLSFKTYAVRHQFDAKTVWTDRKKFYAKCRGFDGSGRRACKWRKLPSQPIVVEQCWPTKRARLSGSRRKTSQWLKQFGVATEETDVRLHTVETEVVVTEETNV
ncbi:hypothetical protein D1007_46104 [Hordeum vulgare]|nr:hypothetical protein D1007_46104 [Hordeum vulgare]